MKRSDARHLEPAHPVACRDLHDPIAHLAIGRLLPRAYHLQKIV